MQCKKCGKVNQPGNKFCVECGQPLELSKSDSKCSYYVKLLYIINLVLSIPFCIAVYQLLGSIFFNFGVIFGAPADNATKNIPAITITVFATLALFLIANFVLSSLIRKNRTDAGWQAYQQKTKFRHKSAIFFYFWLPLIVAIIFSLLGRLEGTKNLDGTIIFTVFIYTILQSLLFSSSLTLSSLIVRTSLKPKSNQTL